MVIARTLLACTGGDPDVGTVSDPGNNTIQFSDNFHVVNLSPSVTVYAVNNWWGSPRGPKTNKFVGDVVWNPYLSGPPSVTSPADLNRPGAERLDTMETRIVACVPNPTNPSASVHYDVAEPGTVVLSVYNVRGQTGGLFNEGKEAIPRPASCPLIGISSKVNKCRDRSLSVASCERLTRSHFCS